MRELAYCWITEQPILVRVPLCSETQITKKLSFSPCFSLLGYMGRGVKHDFPKCLENLSLNDRTVDYAQERKFSWQKSLTCPECTQLSLVYSRVHETCALECHFLFTIHPWQKEKQKYPKYDIFSVLSVPVWRTRPTKICISVSQLYPKLHIIHKKLRFHDTPV